MSDSKETTPKALGKKSAKLKTTNSYSPFKFIFVWLETKLPQKFKR